MKKIYFTNVFFLVWLMFSCTGHSTEETFIKKINDILAECKTPYSEDAIDSAFNWIKDNPQSLGFELKKWHKEFNAVKVTTSSDNSVRAYCVEREGFCGNPSHGFDTRTLIQYKSGGSIYCKELDDIEGYISKIWRIKDSDYYLIMNYYGSIAQGDYNNIRFSVFRLDKNDLTQVSRVFNTYDIVTDDIVVSWNEYDFDVEERLGNFGHGDDPDITDYVAIYNQWLKELYIPKVSEQEGIVYVTNHFEHYNWYDSHFEAVTITGPIEISNKDYSIRIKQNKDGTCEYRCWNGTKMKGIPDLVIKNGKRQIWGYGDGLMDYDQWVSDDESPTLGDKYIFLNNGYRYEYFNGYNNGSFLNLLYIYNPKDDLIYAKDFDELE